MYIYIYIYIHIIYIDRLSIIWKSGLSYKIKRDLFQAVAVSILLYGCTTWMPKEHKEKELDGNNTRILPAIKKNFLKQHSIHEQVYGHQPPVSQTIQTRHMRHCWRSKDETISDVLFWTTTHGLTSVGRPAKTDKHRLSEETRCRPDYLPKARQVCWGCRVNRLHL